MCNSQNLVNTSSASLNPDWFGKLGHSSWKKKEYFIKYQIKAWLKYHFSKDIKQRSEENIWMNTKIEDFGAF